MGINIYTLLLLILFAITIVGLLVCLISFKYLSEKNQREWNRFYNETDFGKLRNILDEIIINSLNEYKSLHPEYSQIGSYMKSEEQKSLIIKITSRIFVCVTPAIKSQLSLVYNFKNDDELINIIANKVSGYTMLWASEINSKVDIGDDLVDLEKS